MRSLRSGDGMRARASSNAVTFWAVAPGNQLSGEFRRYPCTNIPPIPELLRPANPSVSIGSKLERQASLAYAAFSNNQANTGFARSIRPAVQGIQFLFPAKHRGKAAFPIQQVFNAIGIGTRTEVGECGGKFSLVRR